VVTSYRCSAGPVAALLALAAGLTGCSAGGEGTPATPATAAAEPTAVPGAAPMLSSATLVDDVDPAVGTWSTTWTACFAPPGDPAVVRWEVQTVTAEGVSPRVRELSGGCIDLQLAQGRGTAPVDDPGRTAALADAGSLAYRVRAVRADGSATPWTDPVVVGTVR
jgi:hypothetical protein